MDRYIVIKSLGAGSAGEAFVVTERSTGNEYVLKRIHTVGMNREERERASREAQTLQMLNHPNIVRFKESFFDKEAKTKEEFFCIVMERCVCSLEDLINQCLEIPDGRGGFPQSLLVEWMTELLAALSFLQQKNIVHRDIKSSNIFVTKKNHLKIGDFGLAKVVVNNGAAAPSTMMSNSSSTVAGTAHYMPPEVCDGAPTDHKGDVWSLGVLFYELCALHPPFQGGNILAIVHEISTKTPAPLPSNFDARFSKISMWMLQKEVSKRPTAQDVLNKYVFLPPSHPSHPQHDPDRGRVIQERQGPPLVLNAGGRRSNSVAVSSSSSAPPPTTTTSTTAAPSSTSTTTKTATVTSSNANAKTTAPLQQPQVSTNNSPPSGRVDGNRANLVGTRINHSKQPHAHHHHHHHHHNHHNQAQSHNYHQHHSSSLPPLPSSSSKIHHANPPFKAPITSSEIKKDPQNIIDKFNNCSNVEDANRPSAVVIDDDDEEGDENCNNNADDDEDDADVHNRVQQQHQHHQSASRKKLVKLGEDILVMTHSTDDEDIAAENSKTKGNQKDLMTTPQALLDLDDKNNNHRSASAVTTTSSSSSSPTKNGSSNHYNNNNAPSAMLLQGSTDSNRRSASAGINKEAPWNLTERIIALLEAESICAQMTADDLDQVVCAIAEFRVRKGLTITATAITGKK